MPTVCCAQCQPTAAGKVLLSSPDDKCLDYVVHGASQQQQVRSCLTFVMALEGSAVTLAAQGHLLALVWHAVVPASL